MSLDSYLKIQRPITDKDLSLFLLLGVARQTHIRTIDYDKDYFDKYIKYGGSQTEVILNKIRKDTVNKFYRGPILDIGVGNGSFITDYAKEFLGSKGYDINQSAVDMLKSADMYSDNLSSFGAMTFWDSLEHMVNPIKMLSFIPVGGWAFVSIPIFKNLREIRKSKHYRPDEHLWYFTSDGFIRFMEGECGFRVVDQHVLETTEGGREDIKTFSCVKRKQP